MKNNRYNLITDLVTHKIVGVIDCFDTYYTEAPYQTETGMYVPVIIDEDFLSSNGFNCLYELLGCYYKDGSIIKTKDSKLVDDYNKHKRKTFKLIKKKIKNSFDAFNYRMFNSLLPIFVLRIANIINQIIIKFSSYFVTKETVEIVDTHLAAEQKFLLNFYKDKEYKYYFSACLLIKDENDYLEEFLDENYKAGVEHFYIYDNKSATPIIDTLKTIKNGFYLDKCDVVLFTEYTYMQFDCYKHCMDNYGHESRWITFIDTDEMMESATEYTIRDYLEANEDKALLWIPWVIYNANGHVKQPEGTQKEAFTNLISAPYGTYGKCIVQPHYISRMFVHYAQAKYDSINGTPVVNLNKEFYLNKARNENRADKLGYAILLRHYICRSYEEWVKKMSRGTCDPIYDRKFKEFFTYNPDLYYLTEQQEVKKKLNEKQLYDN